MLGALCHWLVFRVGGLTIHPATRQKDVFTRPASPCREAPLDEPLFFSGRHQSHGIRYTGIVDFLICDDGARVEAHPVPGASREAVTYLYRNQVVPLQGSLCGEIVLHGSAVSSSAGALLFLAPSGFGKSTLVAYLSLQGYPLLADDAVRLQREEGCTTLQPGSPSVRLWGDSLQALDLAGGHCTQPGAEYTDKYCVEARNGTQACQHAQPLGGIFLLGELCVEKPQLEAASGSDTLVQLVQQCFALPAMSVKRKSRNLIKLAELLDGVPVWHLDYPHSYEALPAIAALLPSRP